MADLETIPTQVDEETEEERRRRLEEAEASSNLAPVVQPTINAHRGKGTSDLALTEEIERTHPTSVSTKSVGDLSAPDLGGNGPKPVVNGGLQPIGPSSPVKPLSFAERQNLPVISPGAPAGSAASYEAQLTRLQDQKANPWGSAENHPGFGGKLAHVLSKVGNIAGDIVAPGTMELIPGTDLNRQAKEAGLEHNLGAAQTREASAKRGEAETAQGEERNKLESRRLDIEEGKEGKAPSIDQAAIDAKMKEDNPETGKPFTAYEARIELANDIQAGKQKPEGAPKTIVMLDEHGKPNEYQFDRGGNLSGEAGYGNWKKIGPAKPDALSLGLVGSIQPLLGPNGQIVGTLNSKTGKMAGLTPEQAATVGGTGGTTGSGARLANTERNQFATQVVNPARQVESQFQKATAALKAYNANPQTGAAGMVLFAQHLGTTLGGIKGAAIGEQSQALHANAIGLADRISRWIDKNATGQPISESQSRDFYHMIQETREITWRLAARAASDRKQPVDFLPNDVQISLADSGGKVRHVPGNRVQEYLDKGAKIAE